MHGASGTVDWTVVGKLAAGSVPATVLTLLVLSRLPTHAAATNHALSVILGFALIATAVAILFRRVLTDFFRKRTQALTTRQTTGLTVLLGAVLGVLVSRASVGAGAIGVTVLLSLYPDLPAGKLVGSDIAHAVPLTLIAGLGHWLIGSVDLPLLASLLTGSIPGIIIGSLIAARVPDKVLRPILASTLALVGGRLAF